MACKLSAALLIFVVILATISADHGDHDHGGHDHDHHDHDHDHGDGGSNYDNSHIRPLFGRGGYFGGGGGGGGGLFSRLFGWRRRGYYNQGYSGYPNYSYGFCRLSQFVDYVGRMPRFYCDCPPYPPSYQWYQCSPMYGR